MPKPVTLWRYALPSINGEGWAIIVLGSDGFFAAVSDWGNYGHIWRAPGVSDFREFFAVRDPREFTFYFAEKLSPGRSHYDEDATREKIKRRIIESRRAKRISFELARDEWALLKDSDLADPVGLYIWSCATELREVDLSDLAVYVRDPQAIAFCKHVLPRLASAIAAELAAERAPSQSPAPEGLRT